MDKSTPQTPGLRTEPHPEHPSQWKRDALTRAREVAELAEGRLGEAFGPDGLPLGYALELGRLWAMIASVEDNRAMHTEAVERQDAMSAAMLDAMTEGMVEVDGVSRLPMDTSSSPDFFVADPLPFDESGA